MPTSRKQLPSKEKCVEAITEFTREAADAASRVEKLRKELGNAETDLKNAYEKRDTAQRNLTEVIEREITR